MERTKFNLSSNQMKEMRRLRRQQRTYKYIADKMNMPLKQVREFFEPSVISSPVSSTSMQDNPRELPKGGWR